MKNVEISEKGDILTIRVNLSQKFGPSKSGKTIIVASTEGNVRLASGAMLGVNVYSAGEKIEERRGV